MSNHIIHPDGYIVMDLDQKNQILVDSLDRDLLLIFKWYLDKDGRVVTVQNKDRYLHRIIMKRIRKDLISNDLIVHRNGNHLDNRRSNLEITTRSMIQRYTQVYSNNTSGIKGVSYDNTKKRWQAYITRDKKTIRKRFGSCEEAIEWRKQQELLII